jgi:outer membrane protein assembly factor BamB
MKIFLRASLVTCVLFLSFRFSALSASTPNEYKLIKTYTLGGEGGWDSITLDEPTRRLFLAHTAHVNVVNADNGSLIGEISDLRLAHGVAIVKEFGRGFVSDGGGDKVVIFDLATLKVLGEVKTGGNPDCIIYDPASKHIFTFNGRTHDATVIDPASGVVIATVPIGGRPEYAVADGHGIIYNNIGDTNEVVALDSRSLKIKFRWPIAPGTMATAIAMDQKHRRLFIGGRNKTLVIMNADDGKIVQTFAIGAGVDTNIYEPRRHLVFTSTREGMIHIFHEESPDKFSAVATVKTQPGAHTMAFDPKTEHLFLDTADFDPGNTTNESSSSQQPNVFDHAAGGFHSMGIARSMTFRLLVYGKRR